MAQGGGGSRDPAGVARAAIERCAGALQNATGAASAAEIRSARGRLDSANRRTVLGALAGSALFLVRGSAARAQARDKVWRIGFMRTSRYSATDAVNRDAFLEGMRKLGYVEGKNLLVEWRFAEGDLARHAQSAAELVRMNVDLIVSQGTPATIAASKATATIPIVLLNVADPVASGVAKSLGRPGGNVTGVADLTGDLGPKNLELLVKSLPEVTRVAVLFDPSSAGSVIISNAIYGAAQAARVAVVRTPASTLQEIEGAFPRMKAEQAGACLVAGGNLYTQHLRRIVELSVQHGVPTASTNPPHVLGGALMSYGPSWPEVHRRAAYYIDRIFKGARPAELPIEQPTTFEWTVNLKTAKALGITIPAQVLAWADRVIQ